MSAHTGSSTGARAGSADARRRLLLEARAAATLNHPKIAAIYDIVEQDEQAYIVMEYVRGETLSARVRRGRVPVPDAVNAIDPEVVIWR